MSRTFSTKAGLLDSLKLRERCGASAAARNSRCAMSLLMPASAPKLRTLQCVCLAVRVCSMVQQICHALVVLRSRPPWLRLTCAGEAVPARGTSPAFCESPA
jgi:hypothetical protein